MPSETFNLAGIKVVKRIRKNHPLLLSVLCRVATLGYLSPLRHQSVAIVHVGLLLLGPPVLPLTGAPLPRALTHLIV